MGLRIFNTVLVVTGILLIYLASLYKANILHIFEQTYERSSIIKAGLLKTMLLEMLVFSIHSPFLFDITFQIPHRKSHGAQAKSGTYSLD
jgi:hypothetical protein